jgi:hypothetical protein
MFNIYRFSLKNLLYYPSLYVITFLILLLNIGTIAIVPIIFEKAYSYSFYFSSPMFVDISIYSVFISLAFLSSFVGCLNSRKIEIKFLLQKKIKKNELLLTKFFSTFTFSLVLGAITLLPLFYNMIYFSVTEGNLMFDQDTGVNTWGVFASFIGIIVFSSATTSFFGYFIKNTFLLLIMNVALVFAYNLIFTFFFPLDSKHKNNIN